MRQAVAQAAHHVAHRRAFQRALIDQPIMSNVIADLALEVEAATWLAFRFVAALDREQESEAERLLGRIGAPIAKYWICKRAPAVVVEALECHGGNGFIEEQPMARLYREAPLNSVWEGTANMMCMDVQRAMQRDSRVREAFFDELARERGNDARVDRLTLEAARLVDAAMEDEFFVRPMTETMARALQAVELVRHSPAEVVDMFFASRGSHFGTVGSGVSAVAARRIVDRAIVGR